MALRDDEYDVIEETVDFDYFYDEEKSYKRNRKVILKYKVLSVLLFVLCFFFITTGVGIVRMKLYDTKEILTKNEIRKIEFNELNQEIKNYIVNFKDKTVKDTQDELMTSISYQDLDSKCGLSASKELLNKYREKLENISLPNKDELDYEVIAIFLNDVLTSELYYIDLVEENYSTDITKKEALLENLKQAEININNSIELLMENYIAK